MFRYNLKDAATRVFAEFSFTQDGARIVLMESPTKCPNNGVLSRDLADVLYQPDRW
jgi:hypothetical protein